jgi:hypothetical protein
VSSRASDPSPPELIDVVTNSVATTGDDGSSNLSRTSAAQCECTSPVSTTALRGKQLVKLTSPAEKASRQEDGPTSGDRSPSSA